MALSPARVIEAAGRSPLAFGAAGLATALLVIFFPAFFVLGALAVLPLLAFQPRLLLLVFFCQLPLVPTWVNSYSLLGFRMGVLTLNAPLLFLGLFALAIPLYWVKTGRVRRLTTLDLAMAAFFCWAALSLTKAEGDLCLRNFYQLGFPILFFLLMRQLSLGPEDTRFVMRGAVVAGLPVAIWLVIEGITRTNPLLPPANLYDSPYMYAQASGLYQPSGPFPGPNEAGLYLVLLLACSFYLRSGAGQASRRLWDLALICLGVGILATFSRSVLVACLAVVYIQRKRDGRRKTNTWAFVLVALALLAASYGVSTFFRARMLNEDTAADRLIYLFLAYNFFKAHPIAGIGFENFRYFAEAAEERAGPTHNLLTSVLTELGLVGGGLMVWVAVALVRRVRAMAREPHMDPDIPRLLASFLVAYLVTGMGHSVTITYQPSALLWSLAGLLMAEGKPLWIFSGAAQGLSGSLRPPAAPPGGRVSPRGAS